jgi:putative transposase
MPDYRRNYVPGGTFFFTVVAFDRHPFLTDELARSCLRTAIETERQKRPFDIVAIVLLPDHLHAIWTLPPNDTKYSLRWSRIKEEFTRSYLSAGGHEEPRSEPGIRRRERGIWQPRFWEHTCKDERDLKDHLDYVHWNPVKHGLVRRVRDYPWSSFHRYVELGEYDLDWGGENPCPGLDTSDV